MTQFSDLKKNFTGSNGRNRRRLRAVIDSFEIYTINSFIKKIIFENNSITSRALFWVVQSKQKKWIFSQLRWNDHIPYMQMFFKSFLKFFQNFFFKIFFFNIFFIKFFLYANFFIRIFFNIFFIIWFKIIISHAPLHAPSHAYEYGLFNWDRENSIICYTSGRKWAIVTECKIIIQNYTKLHFPPDFTWKGRIHIRAMARAKLIVFNQPTHNWKKIMMRHRW